MKILFVRSDKIGSWLIRWGLNEPASHVAISFDACEEIYHSFGTGIIPMERYDFFESHTVVAEIILNMADDKKICDSFVSKIPPKQNYDYPALLYFSWRAFLLKFFKIPLPKLNAWQQSESFLCTEADYLLANVLAEELGIILIPNNHDLAMISPWQLFKLLRSKINSSRLPFSTKCYL